MSMNDDSTSVSEQQNPTPIIKTEKICDVYQRDIIDLSESEAQLCCSLECEFRQIAVL